MRRSLQPGANSPNSCVIVGQPLDGGNTKQRGALAVIAARVVYDPSSLEGAQQTKQAIANYRGKTCGVRYAEAFHAAQAYPQDIL
jgi:hypothetical protein